MNEIEYLAQLSVAGYLYEEFESSFDKEVFDEELDKFVDRSISVKRRQGESSLTFVLRAKNIAYWRSVN